MACSGIRKEKNLGASNKGMNRFRKAAGAKRQKAKMQEKVRNGLEGFGQNVHRRESKLEVLNEILSRIPSKTVPCV